MGQRSRLAKTEDNNTAKIIHRTKLFGGRETAQEVHRKHAWAGGQCYRCGDRDVRIQLNYHQSPIDLVANEPKIAAQLLAFSDNDQLPVWKSKYGPMVLYWVEYACSTHQRDSEIEAARLPSYILVEIDRGVGAEKIIGQVPRSYKTKSASAA